MKGVRLCLAVIAALATIAPSSASAYPIHRREFQALYGHRAPCVLCHANGGGTERNRYGVDWHERGEGERGFRGIEQLDSDGDGATNLEEIGADSNPGDAHSTPTTPGEAWRREDPRALVPTEQLELVLDDMERVDAVEAELDATQERAVAAASGERLGFEDRHPTLYFSVRDDRRTGIALFAGFEGGGGWFSLLVALGVDGRVTRIAVFRAGTDTGSTYIPFLLCLRGHGISDLPAPGEAGCPRIAGKEVVLRRIAGAVRRAIAIVSELLLAHPASEPLAPPNTGAAVSVAATGGADAGVPADPPTRLDLERPRATVSVRMLSPGAASAWSIAAIGALALIIAGSTRLALSRAFGPPAGARLEALGPSAKLLSALVVLSLLCVEAIGAAVAYVQTNVVHTTAGEYFQYLTWQRLLGISHAHVFGYCLLYGLLALFVTMTSAREWLKCALVATMLWGGLFDVGAWWAIKALSPRFEWLAIAAGASAGLASLISAVLVAQSLIRRPARRADAGRQ